jgi:hypothetical protein
MARIYAPPATVAVMTTVAPFIARRAASAHPAQVQLGSADLTDYCRKRFGRPDRKAFNWMASPSEGASVPSFQQDEAPSNRTIFTHVSRTQRRRHESA